MHLGNEVFDVFKMPVQGEQNHLFVQQVFTLNLFSPFFIVMIIFLLGNKVAGYASLQVKTKFHLNKVASYQ